MVDMDHYTDIVASGYDKIAAMYHRERDRFNNDALLVRFQALLAPHCAVLDVGCGAGMPVATTLSDTGFAVTGIDISTSMLDLAREHVPGATFVKMDMTSLAFDEGIFGGVVAFYSVFHVAMAEQPRVFASFYRLLHAGGVLLFTSGASAWEGIGQMHGADMYWSQPAPTVTLQMVEEAGFTVLRAETLVCGGETHLWVCARKTSEEHIAQHGRGYAALVSLALGICSEYERSHY